MSYSKKQLRLFRQRFKALFDHPFFWILTIVGNMIILLGSSLLWIFETTNRNTPITFLDCILWSAGTVTTVGYSDFTPQTTAGKLTILVLMLAGTLFVWSYMAFLVTGLIAPELSSLERDVHSLRLSTKESI